MADQNDVPRVDVSNWRVWLAGVLAIVLECLLIILLLPREASLTQFGHLWMLVLPVISFLVVFLWLSRRTGAADGDKQEIPVEYRQVMAWSLFAGLALYLVSGSASDPWFYFLRWMPVGEGKTYGRQLYECGLFRFCALAALLVPVLACCRSKISTCVIVFGILIWSQITAFNQLWQATGGRALYGGDHANCLYRLWVYAQTFPRLIFYDPLWNAGSDTPSLVSTGIIPLGTIFLPLWKLFQTDLMYTPVLACAFIIFVPFLAGLSARLAGGGWSAAGCAAIFALGASQHFFHLFFVAGNTGACFALPFVMLAVACLYRVLWLDCFANSTGIMLVLALVMLLAWPPSAVMVILLPLVVVFSAQQLSLRRVSFLLLCAVSIIAICLPFIMGVLGRIDSMDFMTRSAGRGDLTGLFSAGLLRLMEQLRQANPCLIFLGVVGVWFLPRKGMGAVFGVTMAGLGLLAGCGDLGKHYLQLSNASVPLFFVAVIPASIWMEKWLEDIAPRMLLARAFVISFLLVCAINIAAVYGNRGPAKYVSVNPDVEQMAEWMGKHTRDSGRILFAGSVESGYGNWVVSLLPMLVNREILFSDKLEYPVEPVQGHEAELFDFINLFNVSLVAVCQNQWKTFLLQDNEHYEVMKSFSGIPERTIFKVKREVNQFAKGGGKVKSGINELAVVLDDPMEEAVLRYVWQDGLTAKEPVEIFPVDAGKDVRFIGVKPHGKSSFRIKYRKLL